MTHMQIDWREVIFDLRRLPMKNSEIVDALDGCVSERLLRSYAEELMSPGHYRGERLLDLWAMRTGRATDTAPRRPVTLRSAPGARTVRA